MAIAETTPIRHPEDFKVPMNPSGKRLIEEVSDALTKEGAEQFAAEIFEALELCKQQNDLRPLQVVIEAWYRTLLFHREEGFERAWLEAAQTNPKSAKTYTAEELAKELGL